MSLDWHNVPLTKENGDIESHIRRMTEGHKLPFGYTVKIWPKSPKPLPITQICTPLCESNDAGGGSRSQTGSKDTTICVLVHAPITKGCSPDGWHVLQQSEDIMICHGQPTKSRRVSFQAESHKRRSAISQKLCHASVLQLVVHDMTEVFKILTNKYDATLFIMKDYKHTGNIQADNTHGKLPF